jgi:hypothetical protein
LKGKKYNAKFGKLKIRKIKYFLCTKFYDHQ